MSCRKIATRVARSSLVPQARLRGALLASTSPTQELPLLWTHNVGALTQLTNLTLSALPTIQGFGGVCDREFEPAIDHEKGY